MQSHSCIHQLPAKCILPDPNIAIAKHYSLLPNQLTATPPLLTAPTRKHATASKSPTESGTWIKWDHLGRGHDLSAQVKSNIVSCKVDSRCTKRGENCDSSKSFSETDRNSHINMHYTCIQFVNVSWFTRGTRICAANKPWTQLLIDIETIQDSCATVPSL